MMKQRTKDYMARKKAQCALRHPTDLKSFLIAEHDSSRNILVKEHIREMIEKLEEPVSFAEGGGTSGH